MIDSHTHPGRVGTEVIDTLRNPFAKRFVRKILAAHLLRFALGRPFPPGIREIAHPFLLFGVNRDHRLTAFLKRPHVLIDGVKLGIAIRMRTALTRLPIALQAVVQRIKQSDNRVVTNYVPLAPERIGQMMGTFAAPAQRRLRVATGG